MPHWQCCLFLSPRVLLRLVAPPSLLVPMPMRKRSPSFDGIKEDFPYEITGPSRILSLISSSLECSSSFPTLDVLIVFRVAFRDGFFFYSIAGAV